MKTILITLFLSIFISLGVFADKNGNLFIKINSQITTQDILNEIVLKNFNNKNDFKFSINRANKGLSNIAYYKYTYKYKNIPVDNQTIVISIKNNRPFLVTGNFTPPKIDSLNTQKTENEVFKIFKNNKSKLKLHNKIEKVIIVKNNKTYLAYKALVEYIDKKGYHLGLVYLDSSDAKVLLFKSHIYESINRKVYSFNNQCLASESSYDSLPGTLEISEGASLGADNTVNDAYTNTGITYWFYKNMFNRDSFDNQGIALVSTVHASFDFGDGYGCIGGNAFFMGAPYDQMVYGDGDSDMNYLSQALDVTAHELTHAVTDRESNLYYYSESGALNEAMSDIFGATTEAWSNSGGTSVANPTNFVADSNTWKIGEDIMINEDAMRFMNNPHLASGPNEYKPDHYSQRYTGEEDEGGVHVNSTIISLAYYLLVSGGNHPRAEFQNIYPNVEGIGLEKAIKIFYESQIGLFTENIDFSDARTLLSQAAENLYGFCSNESEQVNRAFDIVGVPGSRRSECNNVHSCDGITCSNNGTCQLENNNAVCICDDGYSAVGLTCIQDSNVCSGVDCNQYYLNSVCVEYQGQAACDCPSGYSWNNDQTACISDQNASCDGISCDNHGTCVISNNIASCNCDTGYTNNGNLNCVISTVSCSDSDHVDCENEYPNSQCVVYENALYCDCDEGYSWNSNNECILDVANPCEGINCSGHGSCNVDASNNAACACENGYTPDENLHCIKNEIDLCENVICSSHGACTEINNEARCNCDEGYTAQNLECILDSVDPCQDITCSNHGTCANVNDAPSCICDSGYSSNNLNCIQDTIINNNSNNSSSCNYETSTSNNMIYILLFMFLGLIIARRKTVKVKNK